MSAAERLAPWVVAALAILAGINAIDASPIGVFYDDAHYVILGRALATGEGYRYINLPGSPAATHFPPGYPALLALLWRIAPDFPGNLALFKMTNAALLGGVALGVFWASRRFMGLATVGAAATAIASTVAIPALLLSSSVMSETLFLALLVPLLVVAEDSAGRESLRRAALIGACAGALVLIRSHAVMLIPAIALAYLAHGRYRETIVSLAAGLLALLPWLLWVRHFDPLVPSQLHGQYGSYGAWLARGLRQEGIGLLIASLRDNLVTSYAIVARSFSLGRHALLDAVAVVSVLILLAAGFVALARRASVMLWFLALYLASTLVWPFSPLRFIWGVWPLLVLILVAGARHLWLGTYPPRLARPVRVAGGVIIAIVVSGAAIFNWQGYANSWWATVSRSFSPRIQPQLVWVTDRTQPSDLVVTDDEGAVYLYTGRRALPASPFTADQHVRQRPLAESANWLAETVRVFAPGYVVAWAKPTVDAAEVLVARRPSVLVQVDTIPTGRVYRPRASTVSAPSPAR